MRRHNAVALNGLLILVLILSFAVGVSAQGSTSTSTPTVTPTLHVTPTSSVSATPKSMPATPRATPTLTVTPPAATTPTATATSPSTATQVAGKGAPLELTVYNQNVALVKDSREITLAAGLNAIQISDIASQIDPGSVHFTSLTNPTGTLVLEQNYEYDLVDTDKLLSRYIDQQITVRTLNGGEYTGTLLSGGSDLILETLGGLRVIKQAQIQEFIFPQLPSGLITRPSLNWVVTSTTSGTQQIRITYLTSGVSWSASYVVLLVPDSASLDLNGWITLQNDSGAAYPDAKLKLVAGDINLVQQLTPAPARALMSYAEEADAGVQERSFFEYHLYEVQRPVTVRQGEIKQIEFIAAPAVTSTKIFVYEATPRFSGYGYISDNADYSDPSADVQVRLQFTNSVTNGLGIPLPAGLVRVYQEDTDGSAEFVGEDTIDHTPQDESISLFLGNAFDLVAERKQVQYRQLSDSSAQETWEITLRNHKQESADIQVIENLFRAQDAEILSSSQEYDMLAANRASYTVSVGPNSEQVISYTVLYRW
ncbi:MAG: DUF4139 domain-containing protein [Chloroflexi bacterium]|nr:DUF4139 domain-containing protein [Chloroflexota bacterium]